MRVFEHPNSYGGWTCPICRTNADEPVVLVIIDGTQVENMARAEQVHLSCVELKLVTQGEMKALVQFFE